MHEQNAKQIILLGAGRCIKWKNGIQNDKG